jgi:hypothetical protein
MRQFKVTLYSSLEEFKSIQEVIIECNTITLALAQREQFESKIGYILWSFVYKVEIEEI